VAYTAASYADQSVPEFSLLDCETVDNRGFNLPAVPETVREDGVKIGNDFTADVQVRRAINLAIDRQEMIDHVLNGYGSPAYSVCDKMPWYNDEMENISYDVEKAEEMLAMRFAVMHNLYFYNTLMQRIRAAIEAGEYEAFRKSYTSVLDMRI
jgi:peptide/nickel transport system substrate-binding protein